jgi:hypothetical protein
MKKYFLTFGTENFKESLKRIEKEAKESNFFDEIVIYTEKDIPGFLNYHKYFIENNPKGYGNWIWKPYVTFKLLNKIEEGDILVYLDSGCTINKNGKDRFDEYINLCINSEFKNVSFQYTKYMENQYTKKEVLNYFDLHKEHQNSGQLIGGIFVLQKCKFIQEMVKECLYSCSKYNLIDNRIKNENERFVAHRNDQSIFSCIRKNNGTVSIKNECDLDGSGIEKYLNKYDKYPFWATRLRL